MPTIYWPPSAIRGKLGPFWIFLHRTMRLPEPRCLLHRRPPGNMSSPAVKHTCYHGSSVETFQGEYQRGLEDFLSLVKRAETDPAIVKERDNMPSFDYALRCFSQTHDLVRDEAFVVHVFAWCASKCLQGEVDIASQQGAFLGLFLKDLFIPASKGHDYSKEKYYNHLNRLLTPRGLILSVAKHIPCDCLDKLAAAAKQREPTGVCFACSNVLPRDQIKMCSRCKRADYCSVKCQHRDW